MTDDSVKVQQLLTVCLSAAEPNDTRTAQCRPGHVMSHVIHWCYHTSWNAVWYKIMHVVNASWNTLASLGLVSQGRKLWCYPIFP